MTNWTAGFDVAVRHQVDELVHEKGFILIFERIRSIEENVNVNEVLLNHRAQRQHLRGSWYRVASEDLYVLGCTLRHAKPVSDQGCDQRSSDGNDRTEEEPKDRR